MSTGWDMLCAWGVPEGAVRARPAGDFPGARLAEVVTELAATNFASLDQTQRECLLAWLRAFRHHWPEQYAAALGDCGTDAVLGLEAAPFDPDRYLKLRRIAIENLAAAL